MKNKEKKAKIDNFHFEIEHDVFDNFWYQSDTWKMSSEILFFLKKKEKDV